MKTAALLLICSLLAIGTRATDPDSKKTILIVGFSNSYFNSDSFESIAQGNNAPEDSVFRLVNHKVLATFTASLNPNFEYVFVENATDLESSIGSSVYYSSPKTENDITSIEIAKGDIKSVCDFYRADIVVFINSYEVHWEEEPYVAYVHTFDSETFTRSGERVGEERVSFMTDDVKLKEKYSNKLSRQVSRMLKKLEKIKIENEVLVNK